MAKLNRETIISEALAMLDERGIDAVSTRGLAKRLGVEQPSLYWHFRSKAALLDAMAEAAMAPHATAPLPTASDDWRAWFLENARGFRRALLSHRDGARLHAGTHPEGADLTRALHKLEFLVSSGVPEYDARIAMLTASHFTVGSVMEEQAEMAERGGGADGADGDGPDDQGMDREVAFDLGLALIIDALAQRAGPGAASSD